MAIFGSYIDKKRSLMGESVTIILLDTLVAILAGIIMFPACFTYGLEVNAGPSLLFDTMADVFNHMAGGRIWGTLFFLFMVFAALSTVLGVCENILAMIRELTGWSRKKGLRCLRRRHLCPGPDDCPRLQRPAFSALRSRHGMAGFLGFYRIQQCIAPRFPGACSVLLQQLWLGLGEFRTGSQYRTRFKGEGMDENQSFASSSRLPSRLSISTAWRHLHGARGTNNRMHALQAFYVMKLPGGFFHSSGQPFFRNALSKSVSVRRLYAFRIPSFFSNLHKAADNFRISPC